MLRLLMVTLAAALVAAFSASAGASSPDWSISIASVSQSGEAANGNSYTPSLSADGRYLAFSSAASNLVPGDTNSSVDVFVRDFQTGAVARVTLNNDGTEADLGGDSPSISADGRFVAFDSVSSNLTDAGNGSGFDQAYLYDRQQHKVQLLSVGIDGKAGAGNSVWASVSADGRFASFSSQAPNLVPNDVNGVADTFVRDIAAGTTELVSVNSQGVQGDKESYWFESISGDGRYVVFASSATNLAPGGSNHFVSLYLRDRVLGTTTLAVTIPPSPDPNVASGGPEISSDGKVLAFESDSRNLVPDSPFGYNAFVLERASAQIELVNRDSNGTPILRSTGVPSELNADGRYVLFTTSNGLGNGLNGNLFVRDRVTGATRQVNVSPDGTPRDGSILLIYRPLAISGDGHTIAFESQDDGIVSGDTNGKSDIFVYRVTDYQSSSPTPSITPSPTPSPTPEQPVALPHTGGAPADSADFPTLAVLGAGAILLSLLWWLRVSPDKR